jgi:hypothetical protein
VHSSTAAAAEMEAVISDQQPAAFHAFNDEPASWSAPAHEAIAQWAYALFLARGARHGCDLDDWLQAERALVKALSDAGLNDLNPSLSRNAPPRMRPSLWMAQPCAFRIPSSTTTLV